MSKLRVYIDTSVFGGYFDAEFAVESRRFFSAVFNHSITALISDTLVGELVTAPAEVQSLLAQTLRDCKYGGGKQWTRSRVTLSAL